METSGVSDAIRALLDKQEIREVMMRYTHGIDRLDWEMVRSCYHPDAFDHHGTYAGDVNGFIEAMQVALPRFTGTMHFLGNQLIELDGDVAKSQTYCVAYHRRVPDGGHAEEDMVLGLRYVDRYERREGRWAIAHRVCVWDWRRLDTVAALAPRPESYVLGSHSTDDYWYTGFIPPHPMLVSK